MARLPYDSIIEVERTKSGLIISGDLCHSEIWGAELRGYGYPAHYAITETTERWTAQMIVIIVIMIQRFKLGYYVINAIA